MKKKYSFSVLWIVSSVITFSCFSLGELRIVVDIPTFNNASYCIRNLKSVYNQKYDNYRVIIHDDNSDDGNADILEKFIEEQGQWHRTILKRNKQRRKSLANHYKVIQMLKDSDDVMIHLDGDDFLRGNQVFNHVNKMYQNPNVWVTYGQYRNWPRDQKFLDPLGYCQPIPRDVVENRTYRSRFYYGHLRTCRAWLARHIKLEDCICDKAPCKGQFYDSSADLALMFPLLEMADGKHKFCSKVLVFRNVDNPVNVFKTNRNVQMKCAEIIKSSPHYEPFQAHQLKKDNEKISCKGIIFSNGNLSDLKKCLNSFKEFLPHLPLTIFYENHSKDRDYQELKKHYKRAHFVQFDAYGKGAAIISDTLKKISTDYFLVTLSTNVLNKPVKLRRYLRLVENTFAYTLTLKAPTRFMPPYTWLQDDVYVWKFGLAGNKWLAPHNCAISLYRKNDLITTMRGIKATSLGGALKQWYHYRIDPRKVGLIVQN